MRKNDLTGKRFGRLVVIEKYDVIGKGETRYSCNCDCGNENIIVNRGSLKSGKTQSCGCLSKETNKERFKKYNTYDLTGEYGIGYTTKGEEFYFDLEDYDKIKEYCWILNDSGYLIANSMKKNKCNIRLHKIIYPTEANLIIDHINRNKFDNRKENLRLANKHENAINKNILTNNTSGYMGVSWKTRENKWEAYISLNRKRKHLGIYTNMEDAIIARLIGELKYFGEEFAPQRHLFKQYKIT